MAYTLKQKVQLYHQLFTGHKAALPLSVLLLPDMLPPAFRKNASQMQRMLDKGRPLSAILSTVKLAAPWEAKVLSTGEAAGRLDVVLGDLETFFTARMQQAAALKAKLIYPFLVLLVSIVVGPVPALFRGELTFTDYLVTATLKLLVYYFLYQFLLIRTIENAAGGAFNPWLVRIARHLDSNHWLRQLFEISYLNLLTTCLEAGVDAAETLRILKDAIDDPKLRQQHLLAISHVQKQGMSLANALAGSGILRNYRIISFFTTAEHAGALHSDLRQFVLKQRSELGTMVQFKLKTYGKWLYIVILLVAVAGYF